MTTSELLPDGNPSLYDHPTFTDVVINFNGTIFYGHKAILCRRSKWFQTALAGPYEEAQNGIVQLGDDDDPQHVRAMLRYIYGLSPEEQDRICNADFYIGLFAMGHKYKVSGLCETAMDKFHSLLQENDCCEPVTLDAIRSVAIREWADKRLLNRTLYFCAKNTERLMREGRFCELLREAPVLATELLIDAGKNLGAETDLDMIKCPDCDYIVEESDQVTCGCKSRSGIRKASGDGSSGRFWSRHRAGESFQQ